MADRTISVTFKPPNHKDRDADRRHTEAWRGHFDKHVNNRENSCVNGFMWDDSIIEGERGQLYYLRESPEDLTRDWARMVQLLKNNGFVTEKKKDGWHCSPALRCPNKLIIMTWRIRHALDGVFPISMENVGSGKRASPKQDNPSPHSAKTTGKELSRRDRSSAERHSEPERRASNTLSAASGARSHRPNPPKQPPRIHHVNTKHTDGPQRSPFQGDLRGNGEVYRGAEILNLSITGSNSYTRNRDATRPAESDRYGTTEEVSGRAPGAYINDTRGGGRTTNMVFMGCEIGNIQAGGRYAI
jgi:hypothetical protein